LPAKQISVSLSLPFVGQVSGIWEPDRSEETAAWEMYVELVTRIAVVELPKDQGSLREAMNSLYALFEQTRHILRAHGPSVATPKKGRGLSFGYLAVTVLNTAVRPFLTRWHPALLVHEATRSPNMDPITHEASWLHAQEVRSELAKTRVALLDYADLLGEVAGVPSLVTHLPAPAN